MQRTKNLVITGLLIALGIVLPMAFHSIPNAGSIFLPMHIPVLLCGFICGPVFGLFAGIFTPLISSFATGMPPMMPVLPSMLCELAVYGFLSGILIRLIRTKSRVLNIYITLLIAMIVGRAVSGFIFGVITMPSLGKPYTIIAWLTASFVTSWPGIVIQLIAIPTLLFALEKARLISFDPRDLWGLGAFRRTKQSKSFFNDMADKWDEKSNISDDRLNYLLSFCDIRPGDCVLDIACGTGILDNKLFELGAERVVGIDVADKMVAIARDKTDNDNAEFLAVDFYDFKGTGFDKAIVFNAFPHFTDRQAFAKRAAGVLKEGGEFILLHSESAEVINSRHSDRAKRVTKKLYPATEEMAAFEPYFNITEVIDDDNMYMIKGFKKQKARI